MLSKSDICPSQTYSVGNRTFSTEYAAQRYVATQNLIELLAILGLPSTDNIDKAQKHHLSKDGVVPSRFETVEMNTTEIRQWFQDNVHEMLPVLQQLAEAFPKEVPANE